MKKYLYLFTLTALSLPHASAQTEAVNQPAQPESIQNVAQPSRAISEVEHAPSSAVSLAQANRELLLTRPKLTEDWLNLALQQRNAALIAELLPIYRTFADADPILLQFSHATLAQLEQDYPTAIREFRAILATNPELNPVRIELAKSLYHARQDSAARDQFEKAQSAVGLPAPMQTLIAAYLNALQQRGGWHSSFSVNYLQDRNVNNASSNPNIENTNFDDVPKGASMLPQSAHGVAYSLSVERDFNLNAAHYLHLSSTLFGKTFWDNHAYDDLYNRTYLGYSHKSAVQNVAILPFYEKRWFGNQSYQWANGVRGEYRRWLTNQWQVATALEHASNRYYDSPTLNGRSRLASATVLWLRNPRQFFSLGVDYSRTKTQVLQYDHNTRTLRLGWGQEWQGGISSRLGFSFAQRNYKDQARLGRVLLLGKTRHDTIYNLNLTLWKRDWHIWGITPKLHFSWKKQDSNLPSMYAYSQKNVNVIFEKTF